MKMYFFTPGQWLVCLVALAIWWPGFWDFVGSAACFLLWLAVGGFFKGNRRG
jgi:hypothetical protein